MRLALLGDPQVFGPDGPVRIPALKARALLWYLAAHPDRTFSRSQLAALLWEDADEARGRNSLTTALNGLRKALPTWPLVTTLERVGWDPGAPRDVDADRLWRWQETHPDARRQAESVLDLWRGHFLEGFALPDSAAYEEWLIRQRETLARRFLDMLGYLAGVAEVEGDWQTLGACARHALSVDPLQERFHRWLMLASFRSGERSQALAQFAGLADLLQRELGIGPDPITLSLRDAILGGGPGAARPLQALRQAARIEARSPSVDREPPLVGRERELALVRQALSGAGPGSARAILFHGEAGIGKTRMVEEVRWRTQAGGSFPPFPTVLSGQSDASSPYAPFLEALTGAWPRTAKAAAELPDVWQAELTRLFPDLAVIRPDLPPPPPVEPPLERRRLFEAVARLFAQLRGPVLLVMNDIHQIDEASLDLLSHVLRHPPAQGLALLATARAGDLGRSVEDRLRELEREDRLVWLDLPLLPLPAVRRLAEAIVPGSTPDLVEELHTKSRGNPLFVVEILRALRERGGDVPLEHLPVPPTVEVAVRSRLRRLPAVARRLLEAAAAFPRGAAFDVLGRCADVASDDGLSALDTLVASGLWREADDRGIVRISFGHEVVREVVWDGLTRARQLVLSRRAYAALEATVQDGDRASRSWRMAEQLAYHAAAAGLWDKALAWNIEAAERAGEARLMAIAGRHLDAVLVCLDHLPPRRDRVERAVDTRIELASAFFLAHPERVAGWIEPARQAALELADSARLHRVQGVEAQLLFFQGRHTEALALVEELLPAATASGDGDLRVALLRLVGLSMVRKGEFEEAIRIYDEVAALCGEGSLTLGDVFARSSQAVCYAARGDFPALSSRLRDLARQCREEHQAAYAAYALGALALGASVAGDWEAVADATREGMALAAEAGFPMVAYAARLHLGPALAFGSGDLAGGLAAQQETLAIGERSGTAMWLPHLQAWLGQILLEAGRPREAAEAARRGLEIAGEDGDQYDVALCLRVLGGAAGMRGDVEAARRFLGMALDRFTAQGMRPEVARCHATLSAVAERRRSPRHRSTARTMFRAMGMAWDLKRLSGARSPADTAQEEAADPER